MRPVDAPAVVVAGDALVDLTPATTTTGTVAYEPHPGGSCLNVAVGLGRLGVPTALLARISTDAFGSLLRAHLAGSGVVSDYLLTTDDLTTLAALHLTGGQAGYTFHAAAAADRGLRPEHLAELPMGGALPPGSALHLGSISLVLEPAATTLEGLLERESGRRLISLDPNVRPGLIADRASYLGRLAGWISKVDLVKVSDQDLSWLYPGEKPASLARRWLAAGVSLVVVTAGSAGATAWSRAGTVSVSAPAVTVADTVGAGDAFTSGLLAWLYDEGALTGSAIAELPVDRLAAALAAAAQVAADTCTRPGADPPRRLATLSTAELVARAAALAVPGERRILGITGRPGAGKTTVAADVVAALGPQLAALVPMDGFHYANATLDALGRRGRKGAWDTFDAEGYVHLLQRLRDRTDDVVYAPAFDRDVDESIGSALPVPHDVPLVVTEGNYLLLDRGPWAPVAGLLDECWYVTVDEGTRLDRLVARHVRHGRAFDAAVAWANGSDQNNAELIETTKHRAHLVLTVSG